MVWSSAAWIEWHETWKQFQKPKMDLPGRRRCSQMPENRCGWRRSRSKSRAGSWTSGSALRSGPCASPPPQSPLRETFCSASYLSTGSFQRLALTELCYPGQSVLPPGNPGSAERGAAACGLCGRRTGAPPARTAAWEPLHLSPAQSGLWGRTVFNQTAAKIASCPVLGELTELSALNSLWLSQPRLTSDHCGFQRPAARDC